jgi:hypothetical protein
MIPLKERKGVLAVNVEHCTIVWIWPDEALGLVALPQQGGEKYLFLAVRDGCALLTHSCPLPHDICDCLKCTLGRTRCFEMITNQAPYRMGSQSTDLACDPGLGVLLDTVITARPNICTTTDNTVRQALGVQRFALAGDSARKTIADGA